MRALSIDADFGMMIFMGYKTIECRSWKTPYRGDILFCTTQRKMPDCISGHALCVARLADIQPFTEEHLYDAGMENDPVPEDCYAWILEDVRMIHPFPVKGKQGFFNVDDELIHVVPETLSEAEEEDFVNREIVPLIYKPGRL